MYRDTATGGAGMGAGGGALGAGALGDTAKRTRSRALQYGAGCCDTALGAATRHVGCAGGSGGLAARALGTRPGGTAGLWAVHLVHSACF